MRLRAFALVACACCGLASGSARAELYQWIDAHGQVHVTDDPSQVPHGQSVTVEPTRTRPRAAQPAKSAQPPAAVHSKALAVDVAPPAEPGAAQPGRVHLLH